MRLESIFIFTPLLLFGFPRSFYIYDQHPAIPSEIPSRSLSHVQAAEDTLTLDDASTWKIHSYDAIKVLRWRMDEGLSITQNTRWLSPYRYKIVNQATGSSVEANLIPDLIPNDPRTFYVIKHDLAHGKITLANNSSQTNWNIHPSDLSLCKKWDFENPIAVIIGLNSECDSDLAPRWECILINTKTSEQFIRGHQL